MKRLQDRIAIVTGAAAGIGRATALRLSAEGASVVLADVDEDGLNSVSAQVAHHGGISLTVVTDVSAEDSVRAMVDACVSTFGTVHILVNNAGLAIAGSVTSLSTEEWSTVVDVNLRSMWLAMKFAIPAMTEAGCSIVNMSSGQALMGFPGWAGYAATKGGAIALTQQAAVEYASLGIRVNAVAPGTIMTTMTQKVFDEAPDQEALRKSWGDQHALGRFGEASEVAAVIAFLASDDASFVTGVCIPVDGGMRILGPTGRAI